MPEYFKLLSNLEEHIFYLVQKRQNSLNVNLYQKTDPKLEQGHVENKYDEANVLNNINIQLEYSKNIIEVYFEKFKTVIPIDIDILNLIVKYIFICGKILNIELNDIFGVRELNWCPKNTVNFLDTDYIVNKYKGKYSWGINDDMLKDMRFIFLNIIIPFSNKHLYEIYNNIK